MRTLCFALFSMLHATSCFETRRLIYNKHAKRLAGQNRMKRYDHGEGPPQYEEARRHEKLPDGSKRFGRGRKESVVDPNANSQYNDEIDYPGGRERSPTFCGLGPSKPNKHDRINEAPHLRINVDKQQVDANGKPIISTRKEGIKAFNELILNPRMQDMDQLLDIDAADKDPNHMTKLVQVHNLQHGILQKYKKEYPNGFQEENFTGNVDEYERQVREQQKLAKRTGQDDKGNGKYIQPVDKVTTTHNVSINPEITINTPGGGGGTGKGLGYTYNRTKETFQETNQKNLNRRDRQKAIDDDAAVNAQRRKDNEALGKIVEEEMEQHQKKFAHVGGENLTSWLATEDYFASDSHFVGLAALIILLF